MHEVVLNKSLILHPKVIFRIDQAWTVIVKKCPILLEVNAYSDAIQPFIDA